jgi:uncharacterized protein YndB with AHSA1/START domain
MRSSSVTDAEHPTVEREIRIGARPEIVFQYFVDPARMARWLGPAAALDVRPGGTIQLGVGGQHGGSGQFVEIDPPHRIVYTWGWEEPNHPIPPGSTRVEVDLTPDGDGTLLRFRHLGLPADAVDDHNTGWAHYLDRLAIAAVGGDPGPDAFAPTAASANA